MTKLIPLSAVKYELEHVPGAFSVDVGEYRTRLEEAIARIPVVERQQWLPIESAPKDGTPIIVCIAGMRGSVIEVFWHIGHWRLADEETRHNDAPTHWMPLQTPPDSMWIVT